MKEKDESSRERSKETKEQAGERKEEETLRKERLAVSQRSSQIRLRIDLLVSATGDIMTSCWKVAVERWG